MQYGTDIKYLNGELQFAANGEVLTVSGADTVIQDIMIRLSTYLGSLFYDTEYGSYLLDYILDEDTEETRLAICDEIIRRTEEDPRVKAGSPTARIAAWTLGTITIEAGFELMDMESRFNLVLSLDKRLKEITLIYGLGLGKYEDQ